jgi:phosphoribosylanthranilate isomerase
MLACACTLVFDQRVNKGSSDCLFWTVVFVYSADIIIWVCRQPDWLLVDGLKGGSGIALDWRALQVPLSSAHRGWLLAGGLNAGNVAEAAGIARPSGVDVSSGVTGPDGMAKDPAQVRAFIAAAKGQRHAPV